MPDPGEKMFMRGRAAGKGAATTIETAHLHGLTGCMDALTKHAIWNALNRAAPSSTLIRLLGGII
jgi:hypothetical protein